LPETPADQAAQEHDAWIERLCRLAAEHHRDGASDDEIVAALTAEDGCLPWRARTIVRAVHNREALASLSVTEREFAGAIVLLIAGGVPLALNIRFAGPAFLTRVAFFVFIGGLFAAVKSAWHYGRFRRRPSGDLRGLEYHGSPGDLVEALTPDPIPLPPPEYVVRAADRDAGAASYCPRCKAQYQAGIEDCHDCDVGLVRFFDP
jgi:hypothetical protein